MNEKMLSVAGGDPDDLSSLVVSSPPPRPYVFPPRSFCVEAGFASFESGSLKSCLCFLFGPNTAIVIGAAGNASCAKAILWGFCKSECT